LNDFLSKYIISMASFLSLPAVLEGISHDKQITWVHIKDNFILIFFHLSLNCHSLQNQNKFQYSKPKAFTYAFACVSRLIRDFVIVTRSRIHSCFSCTQYSRKSSLCKSLCSKHLSSTNLIFTSLNNYIKKTIFFVKNYLFLEKKSYIFYHTASQDALEVAIPII